MNDINEIKHLIVFVLVVNIAGILVYVSKNNPVGVFNCLSWSVIALFILVNFNKVFAKKQ